MADTNGRQHDNLAPDSMRAHAEMLAQSIRKRADLVRQVGYETADLVVAAIERYAEQTESVLDFCEQTARQCEAATALLEPRQRSTITAPPASANLEALANDIQQHMPRRAPRMS